MLVDSLLSPYVSAWSSSRTHYLTDGWSNPVVDNPEEGKDVARQLWWPYMRTRAENSRFGVKLEGAGKVRVFAICNPILQALLKPLHDWAMVVPSLLPTDGTYDQTRPILRLKGYKKL
ncbi:hypothetical protein Taro_018273 [Colocasia esculenta]|uniref:Uncharacterized protein n=1 Tax=Colocasia esculenta TaxID=4460 RepID=A0A843UQZ7_COLES|nr:hypothetical protein [Colocasia esculenta]